MTTLEDAVARSVRPGDSVLVMLGHSRWTAAARELARQFWGTDPGFTLVMTSLGALGAAFFRGGLVRKVVTAYSGNSFPTYTPNPIFRQAYESGEVEVEHWSILTPVPAPGGGRPRPARGGDRIAGRFLHGGQRGLRRDRFAVRPARACSSRWCPTWRWSMPPPPTRPATSSSPSPSSTASGAPGRPAAASWRPSSAWSTTSRASGTGSACPGHRVLAVVEAPYGAHPGGCYAPGLPVRSYGEDIAHWSAAADAAAKDEFDAYVDEWVLGPATHEDYLARVGPEQLKWLEGRSDPMSWKADADAHPVVDDPAITRWEQAASLGAREVERVVAEVGADAVLAGAGVANLAAWVAVGRARAAGRKVMLTAELGLWGYQPTPADPYIFNQRVFPGHARTSRTRRPSSAWSSAARGPPRWDASVQPRSTGTGP